MSAGSMLQSGLRVGNYILQDRVGQSAFAQVWKAAHHERPDRVVAVKIATDPQFRAALSREGALPDIRHENVVAILDADTRFADIPYIVMPLIPGGNLAELIARHAEGVPTGRVMQLLTDVLAGLGAAHARDIVHRDIKPPNVLIDAEGRAMITDFGLSHGGGDAHGMQSIMQSASISVEACRTVAGTLVYMAPEVLEGRVATPASDVYAVGIMLFEMLVGRRPVGPELPSRCRAIDRDAMWDALYMRACAPVHERYKDAMQFAAALDANAVESSHQRSAAVARELHQPAPIRLAPETELRRAVRKALADGAISDVERRDLNDLRARLEVPVVEANVIYRQEKRRPPTEHEDIDAQEFSQTVLDRGLLEALLRAKTDLKKLHVYPNLPAKKVRNARVTCSVPDDERVLGLLDLTLVGSGKSALVVGRRGLYNQRRFNEEPPIHVQYAELAGRVIEPAGSTEIHVGRGKLINLGTTRVWAVLELLRDIQSAVRKVGPPA